MDGEARARPVRSNEPLCACSAECKVALKALLAFSKSVVFVVLLANKYALLSVVSAATATHSTSTYGIVRGI